MEPQEPAAAPLPADPGQRVGDGDRDRAVDLLSQSHALGYLSQEELELRSAAALRSATAGDLRPLLADLPVAQLRRSDPVRTQQRRTRARKGVQAHLASYLAMVAVVLAVYVATAVAVGPYYFWPIWPILGGAVGVLSHALPVRQALRAGR